KRRAKESPDPSCRATDTTSIPRPLKLTMPGETLALHNFGNIGRIIGVSAIEEIDHAGDLQTSECDRGNGGHVYLLHPSICQTDTAPARSEDVGYALGSVQIRQYDPVGNLRKAGE